MLSWTMESKTLTEVALLSHVDSGKKFDLMPPQPITRGRIVFARLTQCTASCHPPRANPGPDQTTNMHPRQTT